MATFARARTRPIGLTSAVALLSLAGCHAYYPYGYGGTYTVPQGPYVPQGAILSPTPQAQLQPTPAPAYSETPTLQPDKTVSNPSRPLPDSLISDSPVPQPRPRPTPPPPANSLTDPDADEIGIPSIDPASAELELPSLDGMDETIRIPSAQLGEEEFAEPQRLNPPAAPKLGAVLTEDGPNPFDFDRERYTWLRGVAEFDENEGLWRIQYASDQFADQYSGILSISPDSRMENVFHGDVVLLRGRIDMSRRDRSQKPLFVLIPPESESNKVRGVLRLQPSAGPRKISD